MQVSGGATAQNVLAGSPVTLFGPVVNGSVLRLRKLHVAIVTLGTGGTTVAIKRASSNEALLTATGINTNAELSGLDYEIPEGDTLELTTDATTATVCNFSWSGVIIP